MASEVSWSTVPGGQELDGAPGHLTARLMREPD